MLMDYAENSILYFLSPGKKKFNKPKISLVSIKKC